MVSQLVSQLTREPHFLPLAAILAVIVIARLVGESR